jgi:hypothetical protein
VNATDEDSGSGQVGSEDSGGGQVGSAAIDDHNQEEGNRVDDDALNDDGSDAEDMTTLHVEMEEYDDGDEDKEDECYDLMDKEDECYDLMDEEDGCYDLMDEEDGLLNDDSVLRAADEDMSSHNDTVSSDVLQPTSSAVVHTSSSSSRASNSKPPPSHSKPHPQTKMMKSKRPVRTLGPQLEYEEVSAAKIGGSFSVGCLPKHLAQPKGNALFPGKRVGDAYVTLRTVGYSITIAIL